MSYERELEPLLEWVKGHEGFTATRLKKSLQTSTRWPQPLGFPDCDATLVLSETNYRQKFSFTPTASCLLWKLRYLELSGILRKDKNDQWWVN